MRPSRPDAGSEENEKDDSQSDRLDQKFEELFVFEEVVEFERDRFHLFDECESHAQKVKEEVGVGGEVELPEFGVDDVLDGDRHFGGENDGQDQHHNEGDEIHHKSGHLELREENEEQQGEDHELELRLHEPAARVAVRGEPVVNQEHGCPPSRVAHGGLVLVDIPDGPFVERRADHPVDY